MNCAVLTGNSDIFATWRELSAPYTLDSVVEINGLNLFVVTDLPNLNRFVKRCTHEIFGILGVKSDRCDPVSMIYKSEGSLLSFNIAQIHVQVFTTTYQASAIWGEFDAFNTTSMIIKSLSFNSFSFVIKYSDSTIDVSRSY